MQTTQKITIKEIVEAAILIGLYVAITMLFSPISYDAVQFRISEVLVLLIFFNKKFYLPLVLACFLANLNSPFGWYDFVFGTLATAIALLPALFIKNIYIASLGPVISNMLIVPLELALVFGSEMLEPGVFWYNIFTVGIGEAVVIYALGIPFILAINRNESLMERLRFKPLNVNLNSKLNAYSLMSTFLGFLFVIIFFAFPLLSTTLDDGSTAYTSALGFITQGKYYFLLSINAFALIYILKAYLIKNKYLQLTFSIVAILGLVANFITIGILENDVFKNFYFYILFIFVIALIIPDLINLSKKDMFIDEE